MGFFKSQRPKIVLVCAALILALSIHTTGALAMFSEKTDPANNTVPLGHVDISLSEDGGPWASDTGYDSDGNPVAISKYDPTRQDPNMVAKAPVVTNNGTVPVYVRLTIDNMDKFHFYTADNVLITDWDSHGNGWVLVGDNTLYYSNQLDPGDHTNPPFSSVSLAMDTEDSDIAVGANLDLGIYAEAIQAAGFTSAEEAFGA
jgi:hypothetical protein